MKNIFIILLILIVSFNVYGGGPRKSHDTQYSEDDAAAIMVDVRRDLGLLRAELMNQLIMANQNGSNVRDAHEAILREVTANVVRIFREFLTAQPAFPVANLAALLLDPMFVTIEDQASQNIFQQFGILRRFDRYQYISFLDFLMMFASPEDREFFLSLLNDTFVAVDETFEALNLIHPTSRTPSIVFFGIVWLEVLRVDGAQVNTRGYSFIYPGLRLALKMPLYRKNHYSHDGKVSCENLSLLAIFIAQYLKAIVTEDESLVKDWLKKIKQLLLYARPLREHNLRLVLDGFTDCRGFNRLKIGQYIPAFHELMMVLREADPSVTLEELLGCEDRVPVVQELLHQPLQIRNMPELQEVETDPEQEIYERARPALLRFLRSAYRSIRDGLKNVHGFSKN